MDVERAATSYPLALTVTRDGGGLSGLVPTAAVRDTSSGDYLDWADNLFKAAGWTTKYAAMTESERGHYQRALPVAALALPAGRVLLVEYRASEGGQDGDSQDALRLVDTSADLTLLRKHLLNKLVEAPGSPGALILYDDDGTTPLKTWTLLDTTGGPVVAVPGSPARRSAAT